MKNKNRIITDFVFLNLGTMLLAVGLTWFMAPNKVVSGGVTGFGIILYHILKIPLWATNLLVNIPLFLLSVKILGAKFGIKTLYATGALSFFLAIAEKYNVTLSNDLFITVVFGGILLGTGLGLVFRAGGTTGGTDLIAGLVHHFKKNWSIGNVLLVVDGLIILMSAVFFGVEISLYGVITVFIQSKVIDFILVGINNSKMIFIISDEAKVVAHTIMDKLERGLTFLEGRGGFTKDNKEVIICVVSPSETYRVMEIVKEVDKKAFMIILDAKEVYGEGFDERMLEIENKI